MTQWILAVITAWMKSQESIPEKPEKQIWEKALQRQIHWEYFAEWLLQIYILLLKTRQYISNPVTNISCKHYKTLVLNKHINPF